MSKLNTCRICAKETLQQKTQPLFERRQRKLLQQIKEITGIMLKNSNGMPSCICANCQEDLERAQEFRKRCIRTEAYYQKLLKKNTKQIKQDIECLIEEEQELVQIKSEELIISENEPKIAVAERKIKSKDTTSLQDATIKEIICDKCGNHFSSRQHFEVHMRRHTGDKRFTCEVCPDKFYTQGELKRHMRRHTGERPFACRHCDRRFTDYSTRRKHERIHTNERPFSCTQCSKSFTTSYVLKNHMLTHTGERSFKCEMCQKSFQRQTNLVTHYRSLMHKHNEENHMKLKEMG